MDKLNPTRYLSSFGAVFPQRSEALPKCFGLFGEQPPGEALGGRHVGGLTLRDQWGQARAPTGKRLMWFGQSPQYHEVLVSAEAVAQPLRLGNPHPHELRPQRLDEFHLIAMLDHALAEPM